MKKRLVAVLAGLMVLTFGATSAFASLSSTTSDALVEAGLTNPTEVGTVTGSVDVDEDEDGNAYTVVTLSDDSEIEDGEYCVIIDGTVYTVTVESGQIIFSEEVDLDGDVELVLYGEEDVDDGDDTDGDDTDTDGDDTDDTDTDDTDSNDTDSSDDTVSPKTGEASVLPFVAVAVLAGVVVCGKKIRFYA